MALKTWAIELDSNVHAVELQHSFWSGKRVISLDGNVIHKSMKLLDTGSEHSFLLMGIGAF